MSEPFIAKQRGHAERRTKETLSRTWERAPEVTSREACDAKNRDPKEAYEYRWVEG
jgi:hypothetical protein